MTGQAGFQGLFWGQDGKCAGNGVSPTAGIHMGLSAAVAAFASGPFGCLLSGGDALVVRILVKTLPDLSVTLLANIVSDVARSRARGLPSRGRKEQERQSEEQD